METNAADKPVSREIHSLLSGERVILRETQRAVTPFGGIAVFISFLSRIGFQDRLLAERQTSDAVENALELAGREIARELARWQDWREPMPLPPRSLFTC